jgi:hypothetical protein
MRDFDAALHASAPGGEHRRHVLWSRGWARYDQVDYPGAVTDRQDAVALHGGRPAWTPCTLALGHWSLGNHALALRWFTAAVAANPSLATDAGLAQRIERWRVPQQQAMRTLHAAWMRDSGGAVAP